MFEEKLDEAFVTNIDERIIEEYWTFVEDIIESKEDFQQYWNDFLKLEDRNARTVLMRVCQNIFHIKQFL